MRLIRSAGIAVLSVMGTGCYTMQPTHGDLPGLGSDVAFDVNDVGRVALGGQMGPEIAQVEGKLLSKEGGDYLLAVSNIHLLRGGEQVWTGEQIRLKPEYVGSSYEKRFSTGRTVAVSAVALTGVILLLTQKLNGSAGTDNPPPPVPVGSSLRVP